MRFFFLLKACFTGQPVKMLENKQVWGLLFQNTTPKPIFTGLRGYYFYFFEFYRTPIKLKSNYRERVGVSQVCKNIFMEHPSTYDKTEF